MSFDFESPQFERTYSDRSVDDDWRSWCDRQLEPIGKDVVDLGCGGGIYARGFVEQGARSVVGIDASEQYVREATQASGAFPQARFAVGSAHATGLEDASADIVFHRAVIHHLDASEQTEGAREMLRILRVGGIAVIQDRTIEDVRSIDPRHWIRSTLIEMFPRLLDFERARRPSTQAYADILLRAGFAAPRTLIYPEVRKVYASVSELSSEILARKGKSILHQLSDAELARYCEALTRRVEDLPIVEADSWTVWIAKKL
jgi:ubiquinone/menaquinone biosynthesis C-methylase UbiE